ncbi:hypothetical protein [Tindallia californiensis]|uniref:Uncharacterized protein n=1 Tax=Tindallia californiensis TaxID=159292 RepID=A0A1H3QZY8_9FIRM|nr:hypothetical protein [Tindallia californiensis]SDZ18987.1 hypothetical protein SAMN05192546_11158 [Tindallia californiensis]
MVEITFDGTEKSILKIIENLRSTDATAFICRGNSIQFGTPNGAKQVFIGDTVVIEEENVWVED